MKVGCKGMFVTRTCFPDGLATPKTCCMCFLCIKPGPERTDKSKYVSYLKRLLEFANKATSKGARRQGRHYKTVYVRVRVLQLQPARASQK